MSRKTLRNRPPQAAIDLMTLVGITYLKSAGGWLIYDKLPFNRSAPSAIIGFRGKNPRWLDVIRDMVEKRNGDR